MHQIYTGSNLSNFSYIIEGRQGHCFVIDPFDGQLCMEKVNEIGGVIRGIINTHEHYDHTQGNAIIVKKCACPVYAHANAARSIKEANCFLADGDTLEIDEDSYLKILDTPGHTFAHLCFVLINREKKIAIFTGDTLFNAGIGHCRLGGDIDTYFDTMQNVFQKLDDTLIVYPGHEYLENNLSFTLSLEPSNQKAIELLEFAKTIDWNKQSFQTTLGIERQINTFLRLDNKQIIKSLNLDSPTDKDTFIALRELRNHW